MKALIHLTPLLIAWITAAVILSSCENKEEKQREALKQRQENLNQMLGPIIQERQRQDAQRRSEDAALLDAAGRVIGGAVQQWAEQPQRGGGTSSQQQMDEYYRRENDRARQEAKDRLIRGDYRP